MKCPICQGETRVVNSRSAELGVTVKRRRECVACSQRFSTYERMSLTDLRVRKRNGQKEPYSRHKLEGGIRKATEKRPISGRDFAKLIFAIEQDIFNLGAETVPSEQIGKIVLSHLRATDKVAYLRFASVYRNFKSPKAFEREIQKLEKVS
ncbi:MAG: transcriptional regulator NrdR [bacterium]|nr:transcriptional regulator NrdR [bacterium]